MSIIFCHKSSLVFLGDVSLEYVKGTAVRFRGDMKKKKKKRGRAEAGDGEGMGRGKVRVKGSGESEREGRER